MIEIVSKTDGDGAAAVTVGADGHNATTDLAHTGFLANAMAAIHGVGDVTGDGSGAEYFAYIGGLASLASSGAEPANDGSSNYGATGTSDFLAGATGVAITHISHDGAALVTVDVRGFNGEDFGSDSDDTEAPDLAAAAPYTATAQLTALP
ncbi:MAG: hypothetical protein ABGY41_11200 [Candidatus Poribacteria bacterium]